MLLIMNLGLRDALVLSLCLVIHLAYRSRRKPSLSLPPGLPRWPFVGNAFDTPAEYRPNFFKRLGKKLGETWLTPDEHIKVTHKGCRIETAVPSSFWRVHDYHK